MISFGCNNMENPYCCTYPCIYIYLTIQLYCYSCIILLSVDKVLLVFCALLFIAICKCFMEMYWDFSILVCLQLQHHILYAFQLFCCIIELILLTKKNHFLTHNLPCPFSCVTIYWSFYRPVYIIYSAVLLSWKSL